MQRRGNGYASNNRGIVGKYVYYSVRALLTEDGGDVPPKCRLTFNGLHGVTSHKTEIFRTTGVRTSNLTLFYYKLNLMTKKYDIKNVIWDLVSTYVCSYENEMRSYIE
jgi:hypothetical protein